MNKIERTSVSGTRSVHRGVLQSLIGNGVFTFCQWLYIVLLARMGSVSLVGEFAYALAISAPVFMFANLGLRFFQATDAKREWPFSVYFRLRVAAVAVAFIVIIALGMLLWPHEERFDVVLAVAAYKAFECFSDIHYGLYQQRNRNDLIAISLGFGSLISLGVFALLFFISKQLVLACYGMAAGKAVMFLLYDAEVGRRLRASDSKDTTRAQPSRNITQLIASAWPLGIVAVLGSLTTNIPRYAVEDVLGNHALGIFAGLSYLLFAGMAVVRAILHPFMPIIAQSYLRGDGSSFYRHLRETILGAAFVGLAGVAIALVVGNETLQLFYGPDFVGFDIEFAWVMAAAVFAYMGLAVQYGLTAIRSIRSQAVLIGAEAIVVLTLSSFLVGEFGIRGGAMAMTLGAAFEFIVGALLIWYLARTDMAHLR